MKDEGANHGDDGPMCFRYKMAQPCCLILNSQLGRITAAYCKLE